jgi:putative transposase
MSTYAPTKPGLNMSINNIFYRAKLPHIHPADRIFFITFRLADSLPKSIILKVMREKRAIMLQSRLLNDGIIDKNFKYHIEKLYFNKFDNLLKNNSGNCWLKNPKIAQLLANKIHSFDSIRYKLICYCIMPNHVHLVIDTSGINLINKSNKHGASRKYPLTETLRLIKGSSARLCNISLNRIGQFWQHESYDHYIRNEEEFNKIIRYVLSNPIRAGLVNNWIDWQFTYLTEL